jgi:hypothetical protein
MIRDTGYGIKKEHSWFFIQHPVSGIQHPFFYAIFSGNGSWRALRSAFSRASLY